MPLVTCMTCGRSLSIKSLYDKVVQEKTNNYNIIDLENSFMNVNFDVFANDDIDNFFNDFHFDHNKNMCCRRDIMTYTDFDINKKGNLTKYSKDIKTQLNGGGPDLELETINGDIFFRKN